VVVGAENPPAILHMVIDPLDQRMFGMAQRNFPLEDIRSMEWQVRADMVPAIARPVI